MNLKKSYNLGSQYLPNFPQKILRILARVPELDFFLYILLKRLIFMDDIPRVNIEILQTLNCWCSFLMLLMDKYGKKRLILNGNI
jgi:hypothetical protein